MSYPRYAGLSAAAVAQRRGRFGFAGNARPIFPSAGAKAAADDWVRANPPFGSRTVTPWNLDEDGSTVTAPTDNGQSVRFGFGRGVLLGFPPSVGILPDVAPVAVQPAPVAVAAPAPVAVAPPEFVMAAQAPAVVAQAQAANGAAVVPANVPGEMQPSAPSAGTPEASGAAPVVAEAGLFGGVSPVVVAAAAVAAWYFFGRKGRR